MKGRYGVAKFIILLFLALKENPSRYLLSIVEMKKEATRLMRAGPAKKSEQPKMALKSSQNDLKQLGWLIMT